MATRNGWRLLKGRWTRSLGERGVRVRLFQMRKDGTFYRDVWVPGRGKNRKCLHTRDRGEADHLGRALLAALMTQDAESAPQRFFIRRRMGRERGEHFVTPERLIEASVQ